MIDVEIRGPVAKKEYEKLKKHLAIAGEDVRAEKRVSVRYLGIDAGVLADLEVREGEYPKMVLKDRRNNREVVLALAPGQLAQAITFCASLGYTKGEVFVREVFSARYGGALFSLIDPIEDEAYYYEAGISVKDPVEAAEAKEMLEQMARKFKLPRWSGLEMQSFLASLDRRVNYTFDFAEHGAEHFKDKFGI